MDKSFPGGVKPLKVDSKEREPGIDRPAVQVVAPDPFGIGSKPEKPTQKFGPADKKSK